jgi:hypothetical protein
MLYILFTPLILVLLDFAWITVNSRFGIYNHLDQSAKNIVFRVPMVVTVIFRTAELPKSTVAICALCGWAPAIFYILYHPLPTLLDSFSSGLQLGFLVYSVYNSTAYLIFPLWRRWIFNDTLPIALIDTLWGLFLYGTVSAANHVLADL